MLHWQFSDISSAISLSWWRRRNLVAPSFSCDLCYYFSRRQPQIEDSQVYRQDRMKLMATREGLRDHKMDRAGDRGREIAWNVVSWTNSDSEEGMPSFPTRIVHVKSGYLADWTAGMEFEPSSLGDVWSSERGTINQMEKRHGEFYSQSFRFFHQIKCLCSHFPD